MTHEVTAEYRGIPVPPEFVDMIAGRSFKLWKQGVDSAKDHSSEPEISSEPKYRYARDRDGWYLRYREGRIPLFWDSWGGFVDEVSAEDRGVSFNGLLEIWSDDVTEVRESEVPEHVLAAFKDYEG